MTMTVSTPEGEKSASSVIAVYLPSDMRTQGATGIVRGTTYGIAPILDLAQYGMLIAALTSRTGDPEANRLSPTGNVRGRDIDRLIPAAYDLPWDAIDVSKAWRSGKRVLSEDLYPQIVWLPPGTKDPNWARAFHPVSISQAIGADVRIKSITIEPTRARVIEFITDAPEWLARMRQREKRDKKPRWYPRSDRFNLFVRAVESTWP